MARILVVDDDPKTVRTVTLYLEDEGHSVLKAYDGMSALSTVRDEQPDLIVLDLMLPHVDGIHVTQLIRMDSEVPILMITARNLEEDTLAGFSAGADDYLTKPFSPRELVARIRALLRRTQGIKRAKESIRHGQLTIDRESHTVTFGGTPVDLTPTEFRLLEVFVDHPERVFPRSELVERVFGTEYPGIDRSIDTHLSNLRKKLSDAQADELITTVHGVGYKLSGHAHA